jgi:hypothetical protein
LDNFNFGFNIREAPDGRDGPPGDVVHSWNADIFNIPPFPDTYQGAVPVATPGPVALPGTDYICIRWTSPPGGGIFIGIEETPTSPFIPGYTRASDTDPWELKGPPGLPNHRSVYINAVGRPGGIFGWGGDRTGTTKGFLEGGN